MPHRYRFIPACAGNASLQWPFGLSLSVHPRMRGERARTCAPVAACRGSSPHARGTRILRGLGLFLGRFIPACAGNAAAERRSRSGKPVHPRMRGERWEFGQMPALPARFIPACAGNAIRFVPRLYGYSVHPRMRGERIYVWLSHRMSYGSSPHARGTPDNGQHACQDERFIPACAGNAQCDAARLSSRPVHPRMRGERRSLVATRKPRIGSSPHARGTLQSRGWNPL